MIDYFPDAIAVVLDHEGGFCDDPNDAGGATAYGISTRFLKLHKLPYTAKTLTKDQAIDIYKTYIWLPNRFNDLTIKPIAIKLFDTGVNIGPGMAIKLAQSVICDKYKTIAADGILGRKTLGVLNTVYYQDFLKAYKVELMHYYRNIVFHNPSKEVFLKGWLNRAVS